MQGHCGSLKPFFLEHEVTGMTLYGLDQDEEYCIHMSSERLACLDGMLDGQNVLAFEFGTSRDDVSQSYFNVLASADDLIDTWGPGTITFKRNNHNEANGVASLTLRGGVIHARRDGSHHWTSFSEFDESAIAEEWDRAQKIIVGAQIDINPHCIAEEDDHLQTFEGLWRPLGTKQAYWKEQERQLGLQGGQYINIVYNSTWDKVPEVSLKKQLISNLSKKIETIAFLNACCGLQVSACSGLARRVTMRELLSDLLPTFVLRQAPVPLIWHKLVTDFNIIEKLASEDFTDCMIFLFLIEEENLECFDGFLRLALDLVMSLELTGLQPVGDEFVLGFIPNNPAEYLRRVSVPTKGKNLWLKVLRDSETSATFAYMTPKCLQLDGKGCRQTTCDRQDQIHFLQTDIQFQLTGIAEKGIKANSWRLQDKETHFLRAKDNNKDIVLSATVVRDGAFDDPRLLVKESLIPLHMIQRMFRRQNQRYIQERLSTLNGAQRAFITSSSEAGPWFK
jgi:hypothetical protein